MKPAPITAERLAALGACKQQVNLFRQMFPDGAPLTAETALNVADKFNWDWAAKGLLPPAALKAYEEATAPAGKAYEEATAPAGKAYEEAKATARKAYEEAKAVAFAEAYLNDSQ